MQHLITPYDSKIEPFAWWEGAFTLEELDWLRKIALSAETIAQVGGDPTQEDLTKIRRSTISWMKKNQENFWVFEKLAHVVSVLNSQFFRFDLTGFAEELQLTNYDESNKGMYGWHQDFGKPISSSRKMSVVVQLSDPDTYDGGDLQLFTSGEPTTIKKERGFICLFPSYTLHQVTPVTRGNRQSLVTWISGPPFR
jgi:PKHD-type hydroxylase